MKNLSLKFSSLLLCLLPAALVTGPFLPDLFISLIALIFIIISLKNKMWLYYKNIFFYFFSAFFIYLLIRSIFSIDPSLSFDSNFFYFKSSLFYFRFGFFALAVWFLIDHDTKLLNNFYKCLIITFLVIIIDGYLQYFLGKNLLGMTSPHAIRISGLFGKELILGSYLVRILPLVLAMFFLFKEKNKYFSFFLISIIILVYVLILLTAEKTAFGLCTILILLMMVVNKNYRKNIIISFLISLPFILLIFAFDEKIRSRVIVRTLHLSLGHDTLLFSRVHQANYESAYKMFEDNIVFGQGPKMFRKLCKEPKFYSGIWGCTTHPHNSYIQFLAELGILGFMFLLISFIFVVYLFFIHLKRKESDEAQIFKNNYQIYLLMGIFITLWPIAPSGNFFNNWLSIVYYLPVGFYLATQKKSFNKK